MVLCKFDSTTTNLVEHPLHQDCSLSYKCRVEKCDVTIKVKDDEVLNKCNVRKHNHNPLSSCEVAILTKIEELKIKVLVIFIL